MKQESQAEKRLFVSISLETEGALSIREGTLSIREAARYAPSSSMHESVMHGYRGIESPSHEGCTTVDTSTEDLD